MTRELVGGDEMGSEDKEEILEIAIRRAFHRDGASRNIRELKWF